MSDGLTLLPVNRNNSDLYLVVNFTHSHTTRTERAQGDVLYTAVMYVCSAKLPGPKETSGTEKDASIFSLFWHPTPPVHPAREAYSTGCGWATCWLWSPSPSLSSLWSGKLLACSQSLQWDAAGCGADLRWHVAHRLLLLLVSAYTRGVREFLKFHFLLKIDGWRSLWKLSDYTAAVNAILCHLALNSEAGILSTALLLYFIIHWMEEAIIHNMHHCFMHH